MSTATNPYTWGTGRRKTAVARVRIREGTGRFLVNHLELDQYFLVETQRKDVRAPFALEDVIGATFDHVTAQHVGAAPLFLLKQVERFKLTHCDPLPDASLDKIERDWLPSTRPGSATAPATRG